MGKLKTSLRRFIYRAKYDWFRPENIFMAICFVLCIFWTYNSIRSMSRNWELSNELQKKQYELAILEIEVETMELENAYYSSAEYEELSARAKFSKKLPNETLIYLPTNSEEARNKHVETVEYEEKESSNLELWLKFLLGI